MAHVRTCDICKEVTEEFAFQVFKVPIQDNGWKDQKGATSYNARADVGTCCAGKLDEIIHWQGRVPKEMSERNARRRRTPRAVAKKQPAKESAQAGG